MREYYEFAPGGAFARLETTISASGSMVQSYDLFSVLDANCSGTPMYSLEVKSEMSDRGSAEGCTRQYAQATKSLKLTINEENLLEYYKDGCLCLVENDRAKWKVGAEIEYADSGGCDVGTCVDPIVNLTAGAGSGGSYFIAGTELFASFPVGSTTDAAGAQWFSDRPLACMESASQYSAVSASTSGCVSWEDMGRWEDRQVRLGADNNPRRCASKEKITLSGINFGQNSRDTRVYVMRDGKELYEAATTTRSGTYAAVYGECTGASSQGCCAKLDGCLHEHTELTFQPPAGLGRNLELLVKVGNQDTAAQRIRFNYDAPRVGEVLAGSVSRGRGFLNAALPCEKGDGTHCADADVSSAITIRGRNFGGESPGCSITVAHLLCDFKRGSRVVKQPKTHYKVLLMAILLRRAPTVWRWKRTLYFA